MSVRHIINLVGLLLFLVSFGMVAAGGVSLIYRDGDSTGLFLAALITGGFGFLSYKLTAFRDGLTPREGFAIVSIAWTAVAVFGALPYLLTGTIPEFWPAVFESMSGFTTTGATVLTDVESVPHGVLFWRSLTHWLGGMGIIVLVIAVLPYFGFGGLQLFRAEVPGPTTERLRPRITQTAKLLWGVYLGLTVAQVILYIVGGMGPFDAVNHAFATLATGGFSTKNASIAAFDSRYIQYVTIAFMYLAGVNFSLHLKAASGRLAYLQDVEWRFYTGLILGAAALLLVINLGHGTYGGGLVQFERAFRDSLFQTVSIVTTTGFVSADYELWASAALTVIIILLFTGGMAGSTAGGVKAIRVLLLFKQVGIQLRKQLHPRAILVTRTGRHVVSEEVLAMVIGFVILYLLLVVGGSLALTLLGMDLLTAFGASAATVGNIGPGIGDVGAVDNYGWMSDPALALLTFFMMVGRLEIYTVVLLFHRESWKRANRHRVR